MIEFTPLDEIASMSVSDGAEGRRRRRLHASEGSSRGNPHDLIGIIRCASSSPAAPAASARILIEHWLPQGHEILVIDNFATGRREVVPALAGPDA